MRRAAFERLIHEAAKEIPEKFQRYLKDIAVVVEDEPARAQKHAAGIPARDELLGLYEGVPHTERAGLPYRYPDKVTLFQGPLERACHGDRDRLREEIAHTVWHELAHALGMSEGRVRHVERRRRLRKVKP